MVRLIAQTSLLAYKEISKDLGKRQALVYDIIKEFGPISNTQISKRLNLPINCVTGRVFEIRSKYLVMEAYKGRCNFTGAKVSFWRVK